MFSAPIYWKVKTLVASALPPSEKAEQIEDILRMNSENDRVPFLISLLDEIDFRDSFNRDEHKVRIRTPCDLNSA
jgi:hypothetical protein